MHTGKQKKILRLFELGLYSCDRNGNILSHHFNRNKALALRPVGRGGYYQVILQNKTQKIVALNHLVIFLFFNGEYDSSLQVDHIDGNKSNLEISNLEAVTRSENLLRSYKNGTHFQGGERSPASKLNAVQIAEIRNRYMAGDTQRSLAKIYRVTHQNIWCIVHNKSWRCVL